MRRIKSAASIDKTAIADAIGALRGPRTLLFRACADRACKAAARAVRSAERTLKIAEGARRHVQQQVTRNMP